jgi:hypothetical protein
MTDPSGEDMTGAGERNRSLAERARDIAERANRLLADAEEAARAGEELTYIEDRLAALEEEQRRLDQEFVTVGAGEVPEETVGGPGADPIPQTRSRAGTRGRGLTDWIEGLTGAISQTIGDSLGENLNETIRTHVGGLGGIGATVASAVSGLVSDTSRPLSDVIEREVTVNGAVPITVDNFAGPVVVDSGPAGVVKVRVEIYGRGTDDADTIRVFVDQDEDRVFVRTQAAYSVPGHRHAKVFVTVPPGSPLEVRTQGGQIKVDDVGGPAHLRTAGGSVSVRAGRGDVDAATAGGSVIVEAQSTGRVRAVTMGGQVNISGSGIGPVEAQTSGGSIRIEGATGAVRAHTAGGSVTVSGQVAGDWSLRTAGGSLTAVVPAGTNATVDASGGGASSDFTELSADRRHLRGRLGDGSAGTITMRSLGGRVSVVRAETV